MGNIVKYRCWITIFFALSFHSSFAQIRVVDIIPDYYNDETEQDAEPNLAVNPANPSQMAISAFTPHNDRITGSVSGIAPIYISRNGGDMWDYRFIIPDNDTRIGKPDITIRFGGNSNKLYVATLTNKYQDPGYAYEMDILSTPDFNSNMIATKLLRPARPYVDQPYIQATSVLRGSGRSLDRIYVGNNNNYLTGLPGNNSTVDFSLDAFIPSPFLDLEEIDKLPTTPGGYENESGVRTAIHASGVVYTIFYKIITLGTAVHPLNDPIEDVVNVMLVRDDHWAGGTKRFEDLKQSAAIGSPVATNVVLPVINCYLGRNRLLGSHLSIAVDPNNAAVVYVAWADKTGGIYTLHVQKSIDSGQSWANEDLITIPNAINPALAVNTNGKIGFLYQQMISLMGDNKWETHLRRFAQGDISWSDDILSTFLESSTRLDPSQQVYLGDYLHLMAVGKDFYGVFSASNDPNPDNATFPNHVTYQRKVDFMRKVLLADDGTPVDPSIDPFFFHVTELDSTDDFYVRDFTNSSGYDEGLEPSIDPAFCSTSDIWNMRSDGDPGLNANDPPPAGEDPQQVINGDNFAYARVYRKKPGPVEDVNLHFLYSEYGLGNNYVDAGTADVKLNFSASDPFKVLTPGYKWHLPADNSNHNCLAVEISTPRDPIILPSLVGRVPGWSNGTDLMIFNDNNKAQRNMGLYVPPATAGTPTPPSETSDTGTMFTATATMYALIHNPGLEIDDIHLKPVIDPVAKVRPSVTIIGSKEKPYVSKLNSPIIISKMKPGESRFLRISYAVPKGKEGKSFSLTYNQVKNEVVVNAFTILNQYASMNKVVKENLKYEAGVFGRIKALYKEMDTALLITQGNKNIPEKNLSSKDYQDYLKANIPIMRSVILQLVGMKNNDPFGLSATLKVLKQQIKTNDDVKIANAHLSLLNAIDAYLTFLQLEKGNVADILQTIYLQREILQKMDLKHAEVSVKHLIALSNQFISDYETRKLSISDYPARVKNMFTDLNNLAVESGKNDSRLLTSLQAMQQKKDPAELQGEHIKFLLMLRDKTETKR